MFYIIYYALKLAQNKDIFLIIIAEGAISCRSKSKKVIDVINDFFLMLFFLNYYALLI